LDSPHERPSNPGFQLEATDLVPLNDPDDLINSGLVFPNPAEKDQIRHRHPASRIRHRPIFAMTQSVRH
jgi:hypothetical protein